MFNFLFLFLLALVSVSYGYKAVILGDIHGDYDAMIAILRNNGILDSSLRWRNTNDKVISVGDLIGRGHQDRQVLEFVMAQQKARPRQWIQLLGNHEIMQLRDDWRYAVDGSNIGFGSLSNRQRALRKGSVLGDWMRGLPVIHQEAGNIFMHAGMSDSRNVGRSMGSLNREIGRFLQDNRERQVYNDLVWNRELVTNAYARKSGVCSRRVPDILSTFNAERMFVGHTTVYSSSLAGRNQRDPLVMCDGLFYNVDVGISRWMRSEPRNLVLDISSSSGRTRSINTVRTSRVSRQLISDEELYAPEELMTDVDPMEPNSQGRFGETYQHMMDPAVFNSMDASLYDPSFMWKEASQNQEDFLMFVQDSEFASTIDSPYVFSLDANRKALVDLGRFADSTHRSGMVGVASSTLADPIESEPKRTWQNWFDDNHHVQLAWALLFVLALPFSAGLLYYFWTQNVSVRFVKGSCCQITTVSKEAMMQELESTTSAEHML